MVEACTLLGTGAASVDVDDVDDVDDTASRDTGPTAVRGARAARLFDALETPSG